MKDGFSLEDLELEDLDANTFAEMLATVIRMRPSIKTNTLGSEAEFRSLVCKFGYLTRLPSFLLRPR